MRILVQFPTRQRPLQCRQALQRYRQFQSGRHDVFYQTILDADDSAMAAAPVRAWLATLPGRVLVRQGRGKISACNAGVADCPFAFDAAVLASDDMLPTAPGWDAIVAEEMQRHFPALDGAVHFDDGYIGGSRLITLPVLGRRFLQRFGGFYHGAYQSLWADNELTDVARLLGKVATVPRIIIRHEHCGKKPDALFAKNQTYWHEDKAAYEARRKNGFDLRRPELSICIAALECRRGSLGLLVDDVYSQIFALPDHWQVEAHVLLDNKQTSVGRKRNDLLALARGRYVCFIDDDDAVAPTYVADILSAIAGNPGCDCVVFQGAYSINGRHVGPFDYAIGHGRYFQKGNVFYRTPNHLCPVRLELARQAGFPEISRGEDTAYAGRVLPLLKNEAAVLDGGNKKTLYYYQFSPEKTQTQR